MLEVRPVRPWLLRPNAKPSKGSLRHRVVHDMFSGSAVERFFQPSPSWLIKSSSRRNPARRKTSAPLLDLATATFSRPRAICWICSNRKMWCRTGNAGRQSCYGRKVSTALALRRAATRPQSSKPSERRCAPPSGFGSPPIAIEKVNSSARKFSNITSTAAKSCAYCSPRRIRRRSATHSVGQSQMPNMPAFTPPPLRADRPTRSTICHSPAPPPLS